MYAIEPIATIWRAIAAERPLTQATVPYRREHSISSIRVCSGTVASEA
jgi:hypothetical protein